MKPFLVMAFGIMFYLKHINQFDYSWWTVYSPILICISLNIIVEGLGIK